MSFAKWVSRATDCEVKPGKRTGGPPSAHTALSDDPEASRIQTNMQTVSDASAHTALSDDPEASQIKTNMQTVSDASYGAQPMRKQVVDNYRPNQGETLKLFEFDGQGQLQLQAENLDTVLSAINDLPIQVLSVAGAFRGGKSFLLNIIMLYLEKSGKKGWFEDPAAVIKGFTSKKSMETVTTGIDVWSKPFIMKNKQGEKIAIILIDTQGTNDNKANKSQFTRIFALSTLLSDVQVNNMVRDIGSDKLEQLQYFLEFAKYAVSPDSTRKLLVMLVRDWQSSDNFGFAEGSYYWDEVVLKKSECHENANFLASIHTFMEVKCCLLPLPGEKMMKQKEFLGPISDLSQEFRTHIVELTTELFNGKQADGKRSKDLRVWCHLLAKSFGSAELPEPKSLIAMETERMCIADRDESCTLFESKVEAELNACRGECMSEDKLKKLCADAKAAALEFYDKERKGFNIKKIRRGLRQHLMALIATKEKQYFEKNQIRIEKENRRISDEILHTFNERMATAVKSLLEETNFNATFKDILENLSQQFLQDGIDAMRFSEDLKHRMKERTHLYRTANERKLNERSSYQAKKHYNDKMMELCKRSVSDAEFTRESKTISEETCRIVEKNVVGPQQMRDECLQELRDHLNANRDIFHELNRNQADQREKEKAESAIREAEEIRRKQEQKKAKEQEMALKDQIEKDRLSSEAKQKENEAMQENMRKRHEIEMEELKSRKQSFGWWDRFCSVGRCVGTGIFGGVLGAVGGAATGASTGATIGLFAGPIGTAAGATAGAIYGAIIGGSTGATYGAAVGIDKEKKET